MSASPPDNLPPLPRPPIPERTGHLIVTLVVILGCLMLMVLRPGEDNVLVPVLTATAGHYLGYTQVNN